MSNQDYIRSEFPGLQTRSGNFPSRAPLTVPCQPEGNTTFTVPPEILSSEFKISIRKNIKNFIFFRISILNSELKISGGIVMNTIKVQQTVLPKNVGLIKVF